MFRINHNSYLSLECSFYALQHAMHFISIFSVLTPTETLSGNIILFTMEKAES